MPEAEWEIGTLSAQVIAARGLKPRDGGGGGYLSSLLSTTALNPFCRLRRGRHVQDSETVWNNSSPQWKRNLLSFPVEVPESCIGGGADTSRNSSHAGRAVTKPGNILKPSTPLQRKVTLEVQVLTRLVREGSAANDKPGYEDWQVLGEAELDLVDLLTGRVDRLDVWLPLDLPGGASTASSGRGRAGANGVAGGPAGDVRVVVDFDASGRAPRVGDTVRLIRLGHALDFYPLEKAKELVVEDTGGLDDSVLVSYTTPEGWRCTAEIHRVLVVPVERPEPWSIDFVAKTAVTAGHMLVTSPVANAATEAFEKVMNNGFSGIRAVAGEAGSLGVSVLSRWYGAWKRDGIRGGAYLAVDDVAVALGFGAVAEHYLPPLAAVHPVEETPRIASAAGVTTIAGAAAADGNDDEGRLLGAGSAAAMLGDAAALHERATAQQAGGRSNEETKSNSERRRVSCPITGEPIVDPVVAADGHTYERAAIERWLAEHDTSPLTGEVLNTKALFRNYLLLT